MKGANWLIYGAYGFTGKLLAEEAIRRGHNPVLAGRSAERLVSLGRQLGLETIVADLSDEAKLADLVQPFALVFHAAGPFNQTSEPMVTACLKGETHYLDVSGEVQVFERLLALDQQARGAGIAIIPGVGFNVLATDCLTRHVCAPIAQPTHLEIATFWITNKVSPGSLKTMIENLPQGTLTRRNGRLVRTSVRAGRRQVNFLDHKRTVVPANLGDLVTAYHTTGIPNISTYTAIPEPSASFYAWAEPLYRRLFALAPLRQYAKRWATRTMQDFDPRSDQSKPSQAWVGVRNGDGHQREAWLQTVDSYAFTAAAGVRSVETVLGGNLRGATTPALAFGADFVLDIPGTERLDTLDPYSEERSIKRLRVS